MLRNKEIRRFAALLALIAIAVAMAGFSLHPAAGVTALACTAAYCSAFFLFTRARYARIARLCDQIDQVLHHADTLLINDAQEGELSILQTEIFKMTLRIREQNEALTREKSQLSDSLADIAHQLRTPLTSASLILTLLKDAPDAATRRPLLREMNELFVQMDWLLTSLLKLSRLDAGIVALEREKIDVDALIRAALRPLAVAMDLHDIALHVCVPQGASLTGDFAWLSEAIGNLLKNAMTSAGDGGRIDVTCTDTPLFTEIALHDSGAGFAPEDIPRLFDRFYRGKSSGVAGYGIGLALCRTVIMRQGGTICARNHPQGGALFTIRFPK